MKVLLVLLPNQSAYCDLTQEIYNNIQAVSISLLSHTVAYFLIIYNKFVAFIIKHRQLFYFLLALASYLATIRSIKRSGALKLLGYLHFTFKPALNAGSGSLAQLVEQRTFNPLVPRSNRGRPTTYLISLRWVVSSAGRAADF